VVAISFSYEIEYKKSVKAQRERMWGKMVLAYALPITLFIKMYF
jgi:hypothetical protein